MGFETKQFDVPLPPEAKSLLMLFAPFCSIESVEIVAQYDKSKPINNLSYAGARSFSVEETYRFASSLGDPARMVRSFAGVTPVNDAKTIP